MTRYPPLARIFAFEEFAKIGRISQKQSLTIALFAKREGTGKARA
jgi:hypothetical protein